MRRFLLGLACGAIVGACSSPSATDPVLFDPDGNLLVPRTVKSVVKADGNWVTLPQNTRVWAPQSQIGGFWPED